MCYSMDSVCDADNTHNSAAQATHAYLDTIALETLQFAA